MKMVSSVVVISPPTITIPNPRCTSLPIPVAKAAGSMAAAKHIICVGHAALDRIYRIEAFPAQPTKVRALEHIETGGTRAPRPEPSQIGGLS